MSDAPMQSPEPEASPVFEHTGQSDNPRPRLVSVTSDPAAPAHSAPDLPAPDSPVPPTPSHSETMIDHAQEALLDQSDVNSAPRRAKRAKGKKGRASVPSWDEILFGASRPED